MTKTKSTTSEGGGIELPVLAKLRRVKKIILDPPHDALELVSERENKGGRWSATFRVFGAKKGEQFVLKEMSRGSIRCDYRKWDPLKGDYGAWERVRTGKNDIVAALRVALEEHVLPQFDTRRVTRPLENQQTTGKPLAHSGISHVDVRAIFYNSDHLFTDPSQAESVAEERRMRKQRRREGFLLDLMVAIHGDQSLYEFGNDDVRRHYQVVEKGFKWPAQFSHRRALKANREDTTIRSELEDYRTLVGRLVGEKDDNGNKWLAGSEKVEGLARNQGQPGNPLNGIDFDIRDAEPEEKEVAHKRRYKYVRPHTRAAEAKAKKDGLHYRQKKYRMVDGEYTDDEYYYEGNLDMTYLIPGILGIILDWQWVLAWRPGAALLMPVEDIAFDEEDLVDLIESTDFPQGRNKISALDATQAWQWGAALGRAEIVKIDEDRLGPFTEKLARRLKRYIEVRERMLKVWGIESEWLFPDPRDPTRPFDDDRSRHLLRIAEQIAREEARKAGKSPAWIHDVLKDFDGNNTAWYAYRRGWKTVRNAAGWENNKNSAYVGHWTTNVGNTADTRYARLHPHLMLGCVQGLTLAEAIASMPDTEEYTDAMKLADIDEGEEFEVWDDLPEDEEGEEAA